MKKIISMLLAVVMIVACMATVAFATEPETVTVTFEVKNNPGFAALGAYLVYDEEMTLVDLKAGPVLDGAAVAANAKTGKIGAANMSGDITATGILATATFEVADVDYDKVYNVELVIEENALGAIADKAAERNIGARGLRAVLEETMTKIMYVIPSDLTIQKVTITPECVDGKEPKILRDEKRPRQAPGMRK